MNELLAKELLEEFKQKINDIYGLYHDCMLGFVQLNNFINTTQAKVMEITPKSQEELDNTIFTYGDGKPWESDSQILHTTYQGELKRRTSASGENYVILGQSCIIQIYQYWEDEYRGKVAKALGYEKNDLKSNVFGDIRIFRNSIIHHKGIALKEVEKCKLFTWFKENDVIDLTTEQVKLVINAVLEITNQYYNQLE